jgi:hypothetical protein
VGVFSSQVDVVRKVVERLERPGRQLRFCYEAGPCGYGLHRFLTGLGHACMVVAPSLVPIKTGDRINGPERCCDVGEASPRRRSFQQLPDAAFFPVVIRPRARAHPRTLLCRDLPCGDLESPPVRLRDKRPLFRRKRPQIGARFVKEGFDLVHVTSSPLDAIGLLFIWACNVVPPPPLLSQRTSRCRKSRRSKSSERRG